MPLFNIQIPLINVHVISYYYTINRALFLTWMCVPSLTRIVQEP